MAEPGSGTMDRPPSDRSYLFDFPCIPWRLGEPPLWQCSPASISSGASGESERLGLGVEGNGSVAQHRDRPMGELYREEQVAVKEITESFYNARSGSHIRKGTSPVTTYGSIFPRKWFFHSKGDVAHRRVRAKAGERERADRGLRGERGRSAR